LGLFPKVAAVIHHGGAGTTHAGLIAQKPTLIIPFVVDQFHWGELIYRLGCGPKPIPAKRFSQELFREAIQQLLNKESYRIEAKRLSEKMEQENASQRIIETLQEHCRNFLEGQVFLQAKALKWRRGGTRMFSVSRFFGSFEPIFDSNFEEASIRIDSAPSWSLTKILGIISASKPV